MIIMEEGMVRKRAHITARDIEHGVRGLCKECPGALAINRILAKNWFTRVGSYGLELVNVNDQDEGVLEVCGVEVPDRLRNFVTAYDARKPVAPVTFTLDIPERTARKGAFK